MTIFASKPKGSIEVKCQNCGKTCFLGESGRFCPNCGNALTPHPKNKKLTGHEFTKTYNYFYNLSGDIFSSESKNVFKFYIDNLYQQMEVDAVPIINSSLRSGYSIGLAENKIHSKKVKPLSNIKSIMDNANKAISKTVFKVDSLDKRDADLLSLAVYFTIDYRYEKFCLEKKIISDNLTSIIDDNIDYLIPELRRVYEGKSMMNTVGGIFPHIFNDPIKVDDRFINRWVGHISGDTIFGYCVKLSESYL